MATLTALKKKIAALQSQVERVTKAELGHAIAKIRGMMADCGVTIEHLVDGTKPRGRRTSKNTASPKAVKTAKASRAARPPKYQDPKTGATWSGLGRIPAWIAKAKNRDAFLIDKSTAAEASVPAPARKTGSRKVARKASEPSGRAAAKAPARNVRKNTSSKKSEAAVPARKSAVTDTVES